MSPEESITKCPTARRNCKRQRIEGMKSKEVATQIHTGLGTMFKNQILTDITLVTSGGMEFRAHRVALASVSPYFGAMFTGPMEESRQIVVELPHLDSDAFNLILEYIYSGVINITGENVAALLEVSNFLEMVDVVRECSCTLLQELNINNCIEVLSVTEPFASRSECAKVRNVARNFLQNYFTEVSHSESFLELPVAKLMELLRLDSLCVDNEECVLQSAINWLEYEANSRLPYAKEVLQCVRFSLVKEDFLIKFIRSSPLLRNFFNIQNKGHSLTGSESRTGSSFTNTSEAIVADAGQGALQNSNQEGLDLKEALTLQLKDDITDCCVQLEMNPAKPRRTKIPTIFAIGGCNGANASRSIESYDNLNDEWNKVTPMIETRSYFGCAVLDGKIYVAGGQNDTTHLRSVEMYDPALDKWFQMAPMNEVRSYMGMVEMNGYLYAVGGFDGKYHTKTVERYDPATDSWKSVKSLRTARSGLGAAVLDGHIYIVGGFDGKVHLDTVERYDANANEWDSIASMNYVRNGPGVVVVEDKLYAVGGEYRHGKRIQHAEMYDLSTDTWQTTTASAECISGHGIVALDDIYVHCVGGSNQLNNYLRCMWRYNVVTKTWQKMADMHEMRCGISVAVADARPRSRLSKFRSSSARSKDNVKSSISSSSHITRRSTEQSMEVDSFLSRAA